MTTSCNNTCQANPGLLQSVIRTNELDFDFASGHGSNELFTLKRIQILDQIEMSLRPRPLRLKPTR